MKSSIEQQLYSQIEEQMHKHLQDKLEEAETKKTKVHVYVIVYHMYMYVGMRDNGQPSSDKGHFGTKSCVHNYVF